MLVDIAIDRLMDAQTMTKAVGIDVPNIVSVAQIMEQANFYIKVTTMMSRIKIHEQGQIL